MEDNIEEWAFHCENCNKVYNITNLEIHGYPDDHPSITVCHDCYLKLKENEE